MAQSQEDFASSSEDDAPESVSLAQSKRNIQKSDDTLQRAQAAEKIKKKLKNQEIDRRLKEQAENSKRRREHHNGDDANLQARMERAMQEAAAEMDEDGHSSEDGLDKDEDEEEFSDVDAEDDDEEMDCGEQLNPKKNPNHLPDHLFTSAFASATPKAISKRKAKQDLPARSKHRKRVRSNAPPKDVLIGSRTIRTLTPGTTAGVSTLPSAKVRKFLDRNLGLGGHNSKKRGWERRPVNLGVMRRDGPATNFARKQ